MAEITSNGVALPSPTQIQTADEIIWSSNTGRGADGTMMGDVVTQKSTFAITWEMLTEAEHTTIKSAFPTGFFSASVLGNSVTGYRGTINSEVLGYVNGTMYYKTVSVSVIQQ